MKYIDREEDVRVRKDLSKDQGLEHWQEHCRANWTCSVCGEYQPAGPSALDASARCAACAP